MVHHLVVNIELSCCAILHVNHDPTIYAVHKSWTACKSSKVSAEYSWVLARSQTCLKTTNAVSTSNRLNETKAKVELNAEVRRLEALEEEKRVEDKIARRKRELEARQKAEKAKAVQKAAAFEKTRLAMGFPARNSDGRKSPSDGVKTMTAMLRSSSPPNWGGQLSFFSDRLGSSPEKDDKIVGFDAAKPLSPKEERKMKRRAQSEGVAQMQLSLKYAKESSGVGRPDASSELPHQPSKVRGCRCESKFILCLTSPVIKGSI